MRKACYVRFGPHAAEHLARQAITVSRETLRKWMSLAAYNMDDFLKVSGHSDVSPMWVLTDPKDGFGAGRIALNPNNKEVILGGKRDCDVLVPEIF